MAQITVDLIRRIGKYSFNGARLGAPGCILTPDLHDAASIPLTGGWPTNGNLEQTAVKGEQLPESLKVDPTHLFMSADHLDMREAEHTEAHRVANADIEAATSGWIGNSATGLQEKLTHLRSITAHVRDELEHHRDAFRTVGNRYQTIDEGAAADIIRIRQSL